MIAPHVPDVSTRQFLMKSLFWKEPGELAFRFNLDAFNSMSRDQLAEYRDNYLALLNGERRMGMIVPTVSP